MSRKILTLIVLFTSLLLFAFQVQPQEGGGTLIMMQTADVISWDQTRTTWESIRNVRPLYDSLLGIDDEGNLQANLVESWEISEDGLEYTFNLRNDVSFPRRYPVQCRCGHLQCPTSY